MDRELNRIFEGYELGSDEDEEQFQQKATILTEEFGKKMEDVGGKLHFAQDLIALFRYFTDPKVVWHRKTVVVAALLYFIMPLDAIPDLAPLIGYLDDFGVVVAVSKFMTTELAPYYG